MSWITLSFERGYLLQCDHCGYLRSSWYKEDGATPDSFRDEAIPFRNKRLPDTWYVWSIIGENAHLCPWCRSKKKM